MNVYVDPQNYANYDYMKQVIHDVLLVFGYKEVEYTFVNVEPAKVETYTKGWLWNKKTYTRWTWHSVFMLKLEKVEEKMGCYILTFCMPDNCEFENVSDFVEKLQERLGSLKDTVDIKFERCLAFRDFQTTNEPRYYYYM